MGNSNTAFKGMYNVSSQNPDKAENESHIYRNPLNPKMDREYEMKTLQQLLEKTFNDNKPDESCLNDSSCSKFTIIDLLIRTIREPSNTCSIFESVERSK